MKHGLMKRPTITALAAALGLMVSGSSFAAGILTTPEPAFISPGGESAVAIAITGDGQTTAITGALEYDTTQFDAVATPAAGVTCAVNDAFSPTVGRVALAVVSLAALTDQTVCTVTFTAIGGAVEDDYPITFANVVFGNSPGGDTINDGLLTVQLAPPDVVLGFNPDAAVVFGGGTSGDVVAESIAVTVESGTVGTGTVDNCIITGPNASAFSVVGGDPSTVPPDSSIDLEVTLANSALSATLTCDVDDASADTQHVWSLSAPAGDPVPAPEYNSTPAPGSALTCNGAPGSVQQTSITIGNTGDLNLTFDCSVSGAGFSLVGSGAGNLAPNISQIVTVECQVPAEDAPAIVGNLNCTSNDPAAADNDYPLSSVAATAPPPIPQPNVVPASSMWSQLSLIGLLAALGLLVVGIRRK